jgi:two-component system phosphate regulon response regulator PhoB
MQALQALKGVDMTSVLIVEDEPDIASALEHTFRREGFDTCTAGTAQGAMDELTRSVFDLVLLDLMLPDMSGLEVLKHLRREGRRGDTPSVIVVTARKDEVDRIVGFELGADDYVNKPFSPRELVLRAKAVLDRSASKAPEKARALKAGPIEIDLDYHQARVSGKPLRLTVIEFKLLTELVRGKGRVRSREALLREVWGYEAEVLSRTVDTHVRRLRNKLGEGAAWLDTVRGIGYRIRNPGAP